MFQAASLKERFIGWYGPLALASYIPFLLVFSWEFPGEIKAAKLVFAFAFGNATILFVAPAMNSHIKSANSPLWLIGAISFLLLPLLPIWLGEAHAGTSGFHYLLAGLAALGILTLFFTLLWWGTEARAIPMSLTLPVSIAHVSLLVWCSLVSYALPFVLYILVAAPTLFEWRRQLLATKAPS